MTDFEPLKPAELVGQDRRAQRHCDDLRDTVMPPRHPLNMPRDKLLHIARGIIAMLCALPSLLYYEALGLGACLAYTTTIVGLLYEGQQRVRKEGQVEWLDAFATAAPGWIVWGLLIIL